MNIERIRELAEQAGNHTNGFNPGCMPDDFLLKFVELIDKELSKEADEWYEKTLWDIKE